MFIKKGDRVRNINPDSVFYKQTATVTGVNDDGYIRVIYDNTRPLSWRPDGSWFRLSNFLLERY